MLKENVGGPNASRDQVTSLSGRGEASLQGVDDPGGPAGPAVAAAPGAGRGEATLPVGGLEGSPLEPDLSIVIPAFNEERRLPRALNAVTAWVDQQNLAAEVIVVENGSADRTVEIAEGFAESRPYLRVISGLPRGKGNAVRQGMLAARGQWRFLCDADLSMPIADLERFLPAADHGAAVAIGSREAPGAIRYDEPSYRHFMGRVFNWIVKIMAVPGIEDTQCGFKMFREDVAVDLFQHATLSGWGFDPEILFIARKRGYEIREIPIHWRYDADSRVQALRDPLAMIRDLMRIRLNDWRGVYDD